LFKSSLTPTLAEDRIMCLEIIAKKNWNYILDYIPGWKALTDAPNTLTQLIKQRRRWFNGSMFASFHVLANMCRIWKRSNSCCRNIGYMVLYLYMLVNMLVSYFIVGLFYASYSISDPSLIHLIDRTPIKQRTSSRIFTFVYFSSVWFWAFQLKLNGQNFISESVESLWEYLLYWW